MTCVVSIRPVWSGCRGWSETSLGAQVNLLLMSCCGSVIFFDKQVIWPKTFNSIIYALLWGWLLVFQNLWCLDAFVRTTPKSFIVLLQFSKVLNSSNVSSGVSIHYQQIDSIKAIQSWELIETHQDQLQFSPLVKPF